MIGIGTDIIEIGRVERALERHGERFPKRILTPPEFERCLATGAPARFLARRWAAKEAVAKALGTGIGASLGWHDLRIDSAPGGAPHVVFSERGAALLAARSAQRALVSISDERAYAVAFAVLLA